MFRSGLASHLPEAALTTGVFACVLIASLRPVLAQDSTWKKSLEDALKLGKPESVAKLGAKTIYTYKNMKIVFTDGKVTDVQ